MAHIHEIKDAETHFIVDATTREISNAGELPALVQNDHNSERFTFVVPRTVDGHDMSICNKTRIHYLNIDSSTKAQYADVYEVDDLHVDETDETKVVCTWLISRYATQHAGSLNFIVEYACEKDGVVDYAWNTAIFKGITVKNGINNAEQVLTEYTDILEKWKQSVLEELKQSGTGSGSGSGLTDEQAADLAANTEARHTHENIGVLKRFSMGTDNDLTRPTFMGFPLAYEGDYTAQIHNELTEEIINKCLSVPEQEIPDGVYYLGSETLRYFWVQYVMGEIQLAISKHEGKTATVEIESGNLYLVAEGGSRLILMAFDGLPEGKEIVSVEFKKSGSEEWIDLRDMINHENYSYYINGRKIFVHPELGFTCFGVVTFVNGVNSFYSEAEAGSLSARITYKI